MLAPTANACRSTSSARTLQVLMQTYVFAFYLEKTNESEMFESNQKDLESATEILSGEIVLPRCIDHCPLTTSGRVFAFSSGLDSCNAEAETLCVCAPQGSWSKI